MTPITVVSAPGKVLLAGGYLVLDPAYSGVVVSTSSRFYTVVRDSPSHSENLIRVRSPQFTDATWDYSTRFQPTLEVEPSADNSSNNKFVHIALQAALCLASEIRGPSPLQAILSRGLDIAIVGDNDFYSQGAMLASLNLPRTLDSLSRIPPFASARVRLSEVHKTGLGSSAALITSLVTALLLHFSVIPASALSEDQSQSDGRRLAHNLAQYAHCLAQGKVGSGFDVSAAVFGSQLYTRFDPSVLHGLMNDDTLRKQGLLSVLTPSNAAWNYRVEPFKLPPLTRLMLADVDAGSDTPSLVGKVLKWRADQSVPANSLWNSLDEHNQSLARTLARLSELYESNPDTYASAVKYISCLQSVQWMANPWTPPAEEPIISTFYAAHQTTQAIRAKMREMGQASGVPIEPKEQTSLLNACISLAGVIGGGVPGAGGYDAVWLLLCDPVDCSPDQRPLERVEHLWSKWKELDVSPLAASESTARGARVEDFEGIPGLKGAVLGK